MKTILLLLVAFACSALAQPSSQRIVYVTTAPSGACSPNGQAFRYVISGGDVGKLYACDTTWTLLATAAGGGGAPGGSTTQIQYNNAGAFGGASGSVWTEATRTLDLNDANGNNLFKFVANPAGESGGCASVLYINCDAAAPAIIGTSPGTVGGGIEFDAPGGGSTSIATTGTGGAGGPVIFLAGPGGIATAAATAATGGNGGLARLESGPGGGAGVANSTNTGGDGGGSYLETTGGGAASGTGTAVNTGGAGGSVFLAAAGGGSASAGASNTGGNAGHVYALLNIGGTGSTANGAPGEFKVNAATGDVPTTDVFTVSRVGLAKSTLYGTMTNCADSAGAAACGAAPAGSFVIDAGSTATVVSTTAVTANSQIFLQEDSSLNTRLSVTCNTQSSLTLGALRVTARTAGTSFTATLEVGPTTNPMCVNYWIVN